MVYEKLGDELSTLDTFSYNFVPEYFSHWRNDTINLSSFANEEILIKFETINRGGNNLYIDNIKIFEGLNAPTYFPTSFFIDFDLYPNPSASMINILFKPTSTNPFLSIYNSVGEKLFTSKLMSTKTTLSIDHLSKGIYFIHLNDNGKIKIKSFIKW